MSFSHPKDRNLRRVSDFHAALVAMASHDLREPLQIIASVHRLLEKQLNGDSRGECLAHANRALIQVTNQLNALMAALQIDDRDGAVSLTPVNLNPILLQLHEEKRAYALEKGIRLHVIPGDGAVRSNSLLLTAILQNLVGNAIKPSTTAAAPSSQPGGTQTLKVKARLQRVGREMKLVVHNAEDRVQADPGLLRIVARAHDFQERLRQN
jgi:signal transduction histidine kinase